MVAVVMDFAVSEDSFQLCFLERLKFPFQKLTLPALIIPFLSSVDSNITAENKILDTYIFRSRV